MPEHDLVPPEVLAERIRMIMGGQKITRKGLSEATDISRPSLANKLDGKVPFTYDELVRVVDALCVSWSELLEGEEINPLDGPGGQRTKPPRLRDFKPRTDRRL